MKLFDSNDIYLCCERVNLCMNLNSFSILLLCSLVTLNNGLDRFFRLYRVEIYQHIRMTVHFLCQAHMLHKSDKIDMELMKIERFLMNNWNESRKMCYTIECKFLSPLFLFNKKSIKYQSLNLNHAYFCI